MISFELHLVMMAAPYSSPMENEYVSSPLSMTAKEMELPVVSSVMVSLLSSPTVAGPMKIADVLDSGTMRTKMAPAPSAPPA